MIRQTRLAVVVVLALGTACSETPPVDLPPKPPASIEDPAVRRLLDERFEAVRADPGDAEARGQYGEALEAQRIHTAAEQAYDQAVALDPADPRWVYHRGRMRAIRGDLAGALADAGTAIELGPQYAPFRWRRGFWHLDAGDLEGADSDFREAARIDPASQAPRVGLARVYLQRDRPDVAIEVLQPLLQVDPRNGYLHHLLAVAHRQQGDANATAVALGNARPTLPDWPDPMRDEVARYRVGYAAELKKALALVARRQHQQAVPILERLRGQQPDDVTVLSNLGAAYLDVGRVPAGIATLQKALEVNPDHFSSHLNISVAYERTGDLESALRHADAAVAGNPYLGAAHERRGVVLARMRRHPEALAAFETALGYDARRFASLSWSGIVHSEMGNWAEAIERLERALERQPENGPVLLALATGLVQTGDTRAAGPIVDRLEAIAAGHPQIPELRRQIAAGGG